MLLCMSSQITYKTFRQEGRQVNDVKEGVRVVDRRSAVWVVPPRPWPCGSQVQGENTELTSNTSLHLCDASEQMCDRYN